VQTEALPELDTLLATRRARSGDETPVWLAHVARVEGETIGALQWETDRARFLGRGRDMATAQAILDDGPLSSTVGTVLDPIVSLRQRVRLRPGQTVRVVFSTLVAPSRDEAVALADKYRDAATFDRAATLAWTQAQVQLHHLGVKPDEAHLFQSLAAHILYPQRTLRASADVLARHGEGPAALWAHGISGDTPIVLVRIDEVDDVEIVRQLLRAHEYWRMKQLAVDLVILNEHPPSYVQDLQTLLETVVRTSPSYGAGTGRAARGGVFIVRADLTTPAQRDVLQAAARAILLSRRGTLPEQVLRAERAEPAAVAPARRPVTRRSATPAPFSRPDLEFFNGLGGFAAAGREYVTVLDGERASPAPWITVCRWCQRSTGYGLRRQGRWSSTVGLSSVPRRRLVHLRL